MNMLKIKSSFAAVMLLLLGVSVQAQTARSESPWRWIGMMNVTLGGDEVAVVPGNALPSGPDQSIRAGELFQLGAGIEYKLSSKVSALALLTYQVDLGLGENPTTKEGGSMRFAQAPVEVLLMYSAHPQVRLGLGLRQSNRVMLRSTGGLNTNRSVEYKNAMGTVIEAEFFPSSMKGVALSTRFVSQKFTERNAGAAKIDGSHIGIGAKFYF